MDCPNFYDSNIFGYWGLFCLKSVVYVECTCEKFILLSEELNDLCRSLNTVIMVKSRVACAWNRSNRQNFDLDASQITSIWNTWVFIRKIICNGLPIESKKIILTRAAVNFMTIYLTVKHATWRVKFSLIVEWISSEFLSV